MKEAEINSILNSNFKRVGFSHKISDFREGQGVQNPFDGFSVFGGKSWYWETKRLVGYQAFSFSKIEDHQLANLLTIKKASPDAICLIVLGIWESRKFLDFMFFDVAFIERSIAEGEKSFKKMRLLEWKKSGQFLTSTKKEIDVNRIPEVMIT